MTRDVDTLLAVSKAVIDAKPHHVDPKCCPLPWRNDMFADSQSRQLVVAVMRDDGVVKIHPPVARVLESVVAALAGAGHGTQLGTFLLIAA